MVVLVTCKNEEDSLKNKGARVVTTLFIDFSDVQGQLALKSVMEYCLTFIIVLITCKNEEIHPKMKVLEWSQHFFHYKSMGIFFSDTLGQLTPQPLVGSCRILNPSKFLWLSSLPAIIKKNHSKKIFPL